MLFYLYEDFCKQGAVGLAIWVPSVTNDSKEVEASEIASASRGYAVVSPSEDKNDDGIWRQAGHLELTVFGNSNDHEAIDSELFILEEMKVSSIFHLLVYRFY